MKFMRNLLAARSKRRSLPVHRLLNHPSTPFTSVKRQVTRILRIGGRGTTPRPPR